MLKGHQHDHRIWVPNPYFDTSHGYAFQANSLHVCRGIAAFFSFDFWNPLQLKNDPQTSGKRDCFAHVFGLV